MEKIKRTIDENSLLRATELAAFTGISKSAIYRHCTEGYRFKYAHTHMTTPAHYLAWLEEMSKKPKEPSRDEQRIRAELDRLRR